MSDSSWPEAAKRQASLVFDLAYQLYESFKQDVREWIESADRKCKGRKKKCNWSNHEKLFSKLENAIEILKTFEDSVAPELKVVMQYVNQVNDVADSIATSLQAPRSKDHRLYLEYYHQLFDISKAGREAIARTELEIDQFGYKYEERPNNSDEIEKVFDLCRELSDALRFEVLDDAKEIATRLVHDYGNFQGLPGLLWRWKRWASNAPDVKNTELARWLARIGRIVIDSYNGKNVRKNLEIKPKEMAEELELRIDQCESILLQKFSCVTQIDANKSKPENLLNSKRENKAPGRKRVTKLNRDEKGIIEAWRTGNYPTYNEVDIALGKEIGTTKLAVDRVRKRKN